MLLDVRHALRGRVRNDTRSVRGGRWEIKTVKQARKKCANCSKKGDNSHRKGSAVRFQPFLRGDRLAKPNYSFEKRQKEIAKKKKQEEKRLRKASEKAAIPAEGDGTTPPPAGGEPPTQG